MNDLISRQVAITSYQSVCRCVRCSECPFLIKEGAFTDCRLERFIHELPSAEPERKRGEWETFYDIDGFGEPYPAGVRCSECGNPESYEPNFCPNCGADMRGEQDG